jgi:hypothetical protein
MTLSLLGVDVVESFGLNDAVNKATGQGSATDHIYQ